MASRGSGGGEHYRIRFGGRHWATEGLGRMVELSYVGSDNNTVMRERRNPEEKLDLGGTWSYIGSYTDSRWPWLIYIQEDSMRRRSFCWNTGESKVISSCSEGTKEMINVSIRGEG